LIGLCGRAGSGKSSVARHLEEKYGARRHAFAAPLKRMAQEIWQFSDEQVFGDASVKEVIDPRWNMSPRQALQRLGHSARVWLGDDVWVRAVLAEIGVIEGLHVIEDLRYVNEARAIHMRGGYVLRLHCSDSISNDAGTHPSEVEVGHIPHVWQEVYSSRGPRPHCLGGAHIFDSMGGYGLPHLFAIVDSIMNAIFSREAVAL
jgi:hypothetical protein